MNKSILFITIAVIVMGILFVVLAFANFEPTAPYITQKDKSSDNVTANLTIIPAGNIDTNSTEQQNLPAKISQSQLAVHNSREDCWVAYKGKAYDITSFLSNHPGGVSSIARYCGTVNFEQAFQRQHGTNKASMFIRVTVYKGDLG